MTHRGGCSPPLHTLQRASAAPSKKKSPFPPPQQDGGGSITIPLYQYSQLFLRVWEPLEYGVQFWAPHYAQSSWTGLPAPFPGVSEKTLRLLTHSPTQQKRLSLKISHSNSSFLQVMTLPRLSSCMFWFSKPPSKGRRGLHIYMGLPVSSTQGHPRMAQYYFSNLYSCDFIPTVKTA